MKMAHIKQQLCLVTCGLVASAVMAQEAAPIRAEVTTQTAVGATAPIILKAGDLQVKDISGQPIGTLSDFVISPEGCINMGVVSQGGTRLFPVPWQLIRTEQTTVAAGVPTLTLQIDGARLQQAPTIERTQLRTQLTQANFSQQVHTFFGVQAGANTSISGSAATTPGSTTSGGITAGGTTASGRLGMTNQFGATNQFGRVGTNQFQTGRTNMFPTGRTNLFGTNQFGRTNQFQTPGRGLGRPEGVPPGPPQGVPPGPPEGRPPTTPPPGTPPNPNPPGTAPNTP